MKNKKYLLSDDIESQEMRKNLVDLLESCETTNLKLAFTLMLGGGVHQSFCEYLSVITLFSKNNEVQEEAKELLQQAKVLIDSDVNEFLEEQEVTELLEELLQKNPKLDKKILGNYNLKFLEADFGGHFCFKYQTETPRNILKEIVKYQKGIYLRDFDLKVFPIEATDFPEAKWLDIRGNQFKEIPDEIAKLTNLVGIKLEIEELSKESLKRLDNTFPTIMCENYYNYGHKCRQKSEINAAKWFARSARLDNSYAEAWHNEGASFLRTDEPIKGKKALLKAIKKYEQRLEKNMNFGYNTFWKSCCFALDDFPINWLKN
jgi:hypothetical protein